MPETLLEAWEMILALRAQIEALGQSAQAAQRTIEQQNHLLAQYARRLYGRSSERFDPAQLMLALGLPASLRRLRRRPGHGRLPLPPHLERVVVEVDVPECQRRCPVTGQPMELIGYDDSEKLEYQPGRLFVRVYRRNKYVSPDRGAGALVGVVTAPLPDHPIDRCKAGCGLLAHAIVSRFADHLPWYRQDLIFQREGVSLGRSTLDGWALAVADALQPLGTALKQAVLDTDVIFTDDSAPRRRGKEALVAA
jgi:transposase